MDNQGIRIPSVDAKDLYIANHLVEESLEGYTLTRRDGTINMKKFINVLDYSLDLIKIRQVYDRVYRNKQFSFIANGYEHTTRVINVTFKYSVKEYNRIGNNIYVKNGYRLDEDLPDTGVLIKDGTLIAIKVDTKVKEPVNACYLGKNFKYVDGKYQTSYINTVMNVSQLRQELYSNGFYFEGVHYVRFKRSSGSSRVGKCLFIDERMYPAMHKFDMHGIKINRGQPVDLAALEAYMALTLSSIIDTIEIDPASILVIDDYDSVFKDNVVATRSVDGRLMTGEEEITVSNSIWDGQSLIDVSIMGEYSCYGMILLRNHFFKSCAFNTNIQKFFTDNGIISVEQLNGVTLATDVNQIKLITTPSSIKYTKFGSIKKWLRSTGSTFGVVKHEKKTHFFDGRMVQVHYQLLNTLQFSYNEMYEFLKPSLYYMDLLKTEPAVLRHHIKLPEDSDIRMSKTLSKNDIVFQLLGINEHFTDTKMYREFCKNTIAAYKQNLMYGHVLVKGNYSTLFGNPLEMLKHSIGQFDGNSCLGVGNVCSKRFKNREKLLGTRSPHVCVSNILLCNNVHNSDIDTYFNLTNEIVCINSIKENILQKLSGADFDSDTILLTNDSLLISIAERNYDKFKVSTSAVESTKTQRYYTPEQQADLDIKTSVNKIGEIVNLSQELQTLMWHKLNNGASYEDIKELYYDTCQLNVMSGLEIDSAKKEFDINNEYELRMLRDKWMRRDHKGRYIKPYFFGHVDKVKGFYNKERKNYLKHDTSMDYLADILSKYKSPRIRRKPVHISEILTPINVLRPSRRHIERILYEISQFKKTSYYIWSEYTDSSDQYQFYLQAENELIDSINKSDLNLETLYALIRKLEDGDNSDFVLKILFNIGNNQAFELLKQSATDISLLEEDLDGDISLYGIKFKKIQKTI